jgi:hypothetical protein
MGTDKYNKEGSFEEMAEAAEQVETTKVETPKVETNETTE